MNLEELTRQAVQAALEAGELLSVPIGIARLRFSTRREGTLMRRKS